VAALNKFPRPFILLLSSLKPVTCSACNALSYTGCPVTMPILQDLIPKVILSQKCHENDSDSYRLRSYGYLKFKMVWSLRRTSGSFMRLAVPKIRRCNSSLLFTLLSHTMFYMQPWRTEVRWPRWPILRTTTTNPSGRDLLIQELRHVSTDMLDAPSRWKCICNHISCRSNNLQFLSVAP
jgi:hypothetical protein